MMGSNTRKGFLNRYKRLDNEYSEFRGYHNELSQNILAHRGRFMGDGKKIKRNTKQINNHARLASRTLQGGLIAGVSSPASPWFQLGTPDPDLMLFKPVKLWLARVELIMREVFAQSNIYNSLHSLYGELGNFAISPMGIFKDFEHVIHTQIYTVGSYRVASNEKGVIDTFYREYELTVDQMIKKWGKEKVSQQVVEMFANGNTETKRKILHVIETNDNRDHMSPASWNKPIRSVYIELDVQDELKIKSGFDDFPIVCPRWDVIGEETYGTGCPGMDCLGDTKALQLGERRSAQAIDIMVKPPLQGPSSFARYEGSGGLLPGDIITGDDPNGKGLRSVYDTNFSINDHEGKLEQIMERIDEAYYVDLFKMLSSERRSNVTAREVVELHEEKLLMLGPVLTRLHNELLDPVIDRTFNIMQDVGMLPPPPKELAETELSVNYISVLAQAQRMSVITNINEFTGYVAGLAEIYPEARHKLNATRAIDKVGIALAVDPDIIRTDDEVEELSAADQQQQAIQQMTEAAPGMAQAAATVSEIDPAGDMLQQLTGSAPPP